MEFHPDPAREKNKALFYHHISIKVSNTFQGNSSSGRLDWANCANEFKKKELWRATC